jgi:hypothetical protein
VKAQRDLAKAVERGFQVLDTGERQSSGSAEPFLIL